MEDPRSWWVGAEAAAELLSEGPGEGAEGPGEGAEGPGEGAEGWGEGAEGPGEGTEGLGEGSEGPGELSEGPGDGGAEGPGDGGAEGSALQGSDLLSAAGLAEGGGSLAQPLQSVGVVSFCAFDPDQVWGREDGTAFLGNFHELGPGGLHLEAPCEPGPKFFRSAEAAFHALRYWPLAGLFANLSGRRALEKQRRLAEHGDDTYSGYGCAWRAMRAVLAAKFRPQTALAASLVGTGDAFLLAHAHAPAKEGVWSDGCDGEGTNWLGLQLLLLRDSLSGESRWTDFLAAMLDLETGLPRNADAAELWQDAVRTAVDAISEQPGRPLDAPSSGSWE